jgi:uncharacterized protein YfaS (alpha-2-macroglobulin family)
VKAPILTAHLAKYRPLVIAAVLAAAALPPVSTSAADKPAAAKKTPPAPAAAARPVFKTEPQPLANDYKPFVGEPFFLLTDATFGSNEMAKVRIEVNSPGALAQTGGIDVRVYRVPDALGFLQKQKNLHRVQIDAAPADPGVSNTLTHLWDSWQVKARLAWQDLFTGQARRDVVAQVPVLKTPRDLKSPSTFEEPTQFKPIAGLALLDHFRYPIQNAQPIGLPKDVALQGSSSNFVSPTEGNVFVPLGKRAPGLYLVEALAGNYRATTLMFVSDSVAITKVSGDQMLVWSARRGDGAPVHGTRVVWTDGVGALKSGVTDAAGVAMLDRKSPEQSYVFGADPKGGVFVSENFYYDSEIYAAKVYAVTDRPLYRPGDTVNVHVTGREFRSARESVALADADLTLAVVDPLGQVVVRQQQRFSGTQGADARFALADGAPGGGYELRMTLGTDTYTAAFRVSEYQKPHFEIGVLPAKPDFKTGEAVEGKLQLNYPDGKPVANARVSLTARAQQLTMVEGDLDYGGQFPLKLTQAELTTDAKGVAAFSLPAADQPSRYVITALATDGAAYRVRTSRELLVERGSTSYRLMPDRQFSRAAENVTYRIAASQRSTAIAGSPQAAALAGADAAPRPATWEWLRLENRATASGTLGAGDSFAIAYPQPGSYTLRLRDDHGRIVAAASHWVSGDGLKAPAGSIGIVFDRPQYHAGDTADALVSFSEPVDNALLTLERDHVEGTARLGDSASWVRSERISPTQWKLHVAVRDEMSPNITLSIAYVKNGDYVFQNQGLLVEQPRIALGFHTAKAVYAPGERVEVDVQSTLGGKPVSADVNVGVVDEMIYVLQPEIAPRIEDFFFHPRRDNVRTSASLSFIGYDLATSKLGDAPRRGQVNERAVKVLERPRRDNVDTAAWLPRLTTDSSGHAHFSFVMPDSLTRWRFTGRAIDAKGNVGQQIAWVRSDKPFYAKWTSPNWQREGDKATAAVALFNQTGADAAVDWQASAPGFERSGKVTLKPGVNFIDVPLAADRTGPLPLQLTIRRDAQVVDQLALDLQRLPVGWRAPRELQFNLAAGAPALQLPADATHVRVAFAQDAAAGEFRRWMDSLIEFPYGCVEQTSSRMLPLSMALESLAPTQQGAAPQLAQRLASARTSLVAMAGPNARFGWWGRGMKDDTFLTTYAYYADWRATQALHLTLPPEHWQGLLEAYAASDASSMTPLQRAMALAWMQEMGLPVTSMVQARLDDSATAATPKSMPVRQTASFVIREQGSEAIDDMALVLNVATAGRARVSVGADVKTRADAAATRLAANDQPFVRALLMASQRSSAAAAPELLAEVSTRVPTIDRAQTLVWLQRALGHRVDAVALDAAALTLPAPWQRTTGPSGEPVWTWPADQPRPTSLPLPAGGKPAFAAVDFESVEAGMPTLPVHLVRKLWKLVPQKDAAKAATGDAAAAPGSDGRLVVRLELVAPGTPLSTDTLYLDEIAVSGNVALRHALVEAGLPPGASVEASTWGIDIETGADKVVSLERAQQQDIPQGYAIPIDTLNAGESLSVRHLVRFAQRGQFNVPAVRLHRMYDPEAKAIDTSGAWAKWTVQ